MMKYQIKINTSKGDKIKVVSQNFMTLGSDAKNQIRIKGTKPNHCALLVTPGKVLVKLLDPEAACWINSSPVVTESEFNIGDQLTLSGCTHVTFTLEELEKSRRKKSSSSSLPSSEVSPNTLNNKTDAPTPDPNPNTTHPLPSSSFLTNNKMESNLEGPKPMSPPNNDSVCGEKPIENPDHPHNIVNQRSETESLSHKSPHKKKPQKEESLDNENPSPKIPQQKKSLKDESSDMETPSRKTPQKRKKSLKEESLDNETPSHKIPQQKKSLKEGSLDNETPSHKISQQMKSLKDELDMETPSHMIPQQKKTPKEGDLNSEKVSPVKSEIASLLKKKEVFASSSASGSKKILSRTVEGELQSPEKRSTPEKNTKDLQSSNEITNLSLHYENDNMLKFKSSLGFTPIRRRTYTARSQDSSETVDINSDSNSIVKKNILQIQTRTSGELVHDGSLSPVLTQNSPPGSTNKTPDDESLSSPKLTQSSPPRTDIKPSKPKTPSPQKKIKPSNEESPSPPKKKREASTPRSKVISVNENKRRRRSCQITEKQPYTSVSSSSTDLTLSNLFKKDKKDSTETSSSIDRKNHKRDLETKRKKYSSDSTSPQNRKTSRYKRNRNSLKKYSSYSSSSDSSSSSESRNTNRYKRNSRKNVKNYRSSDSSSDSSMESLKRRSNTNSRKRRRSQADFPHFIIDTEGLMSLSYFDKLGSLKFPPVSNSKRSKRPVRYGVMVYPL